MSYVRRPIKAGVLGLAVPASKRKDAIHWLIAGAAEGVFDDQINQAMACSPHRGRPRKRAWVRNAMINALLKKLQKYFGDAPIGESSPIALQAPEAGACIQVVVDENGNLQPPKIRKNARIYSIGDVHGKIDLFNKAMDRIKGDLEKRPIVESHIVLLGDYIDRGLESRAVLDAIMAEEANRPIIALKGNHEDMLLRALDDEDDFRNWCDFGGVQTIFSYGIDVQDLMVGKGHEKSREALKNSIPEQHVAWLRSLRAHWQYDDFFFCHAGVNPARPLEAQSDEDLLWVRGDFLDHAGAFAKVVVHGHSPVAAVDLRTNRINLDTGAYFSGKLSCIAIDFGGIQVV